MEKTKVVETIKTKCNSVTIEATVNYVTKDVSVSYSDYDNPEMQVSGGLGLSADCIEEIDYLLNVNTALLEVYTEVKRCLTKSDNIQELTNAIETMDSVCDKLDTDIKQIADKENFLRGTTKEIEKQFDVKEEKKYISVAGNPLEKIYEDDNQYLALDSSGYMMINSKVYWYSKPFYTFCNSKGELI